jgi:hypothetical protein
MVVFVGFHVIRDRCLMLCYGYLELFLFFLIKKYLKVGNISFSRNMFFKTIRTLIRCDLINLTGLKTINNYITTAISNNIISPSSSYNSIISLQQQQKIAAKDSSKRQ